MSHNKKLVIVESSSKCGSIETYLGAAYYKCISCNGHIRCITDLKSINTKKNFETTYTIDPDKKQHVDKMKAIISTFRKENIILATDHDREGEAIAWHICEVFGLSVDTTPRIIFHEVTKPALQLAIENPRKIDMNMVRSQQARQVLDMLVGFCISPLLWKHLSNNNTLSAGRCQTPALRLVYENDLKSKETATTQKHKVSACFFPQNLMFDLDTDFETESEVKAFMELSPTHEHNLIVHPQRLAERSPPKPFNTSALLQAANNALHLGAKETMSCCQTLYQMGHITYMRTENRKYSPTFIEIVSKYIVEQWSDNHVHPQLLETHGNTDSNNPHEAIRVTNVKMREIMMVGDVKDTNMIAKVYKLIWMNTIQSCMAPAVFNTMPLEVSAPQQHKYKHLLEMPKFKGFLVLQSETAAATATACTPELFSSMAMRQSQGTRAINYNYIQSTVGYTNRHTRYSEASLINKLEDLGIGRPSTFASLVDIIQTRKYVGKRDIKGTKIICIEYMLRGGGEKQPIEKKVEKTVGGEHGKLAIEPTGIVAIEFLLDHFESLFSYDYTKKMEDRLDLVASGQEPWHAVCEDAYKDIKRQVKVVDKLEYKLADNDEFVLVFSKFSNFVLKDKEAKVYKATKKDFKPDMDKLRRGEYTFEEVAQTEDRVLGEWNGHKVTIKIGKYGPYLEYNEGMHTSIDGLKKPVEEIVLEDVVSFMDCRVLTPELSIRTGKFGEYIFYKTTEMEKPQFFNLKGCEDHATRNTNELVEWITKTHLIQKKKRSSKDAAKDQVKEKKQKKS